MTGKINQLVKDYSLAHISLLLQLTRFFLNNWRYRYLLILLGFQGPFRIDLFVNKAHLDRLVYRHVEVQFLNLYYNIVLRHQICPVYDLQSQLNSNRLRFEDFHKHKFLSLWAHLDNSHSFRFQTEFVLTPYHSQYFPNNFLRHYQNYLLSCLHRHFWLKQKKPGWYW